MKIGEAFPSQFLKTADLGNRRVMVTIDRVEVRGIGDNETKPVVYFQGKNKGLVLNKTNASTISDIARTDETDRWRGLSIVLYPTKADYQGRRVDCIRIDPATNTRGPAPPEPEPMATDFVATDSDIPFSFAGYLPFFATLVLPFLT